MARLPNLQILIHLLSLIISSLQASTPVSPSYQAGVVEFFDDVESSLTSSQKLTAFIGTYLEIMLDAPSDLDIIVFPEGTLNNMETAVLIPEPEQNLSPCDSSDFMPDDPVKKMSCSAKFHKRYVVVNMMVKVKCPDPAMIANDERDCFVGNEGKSYYNTNVVFDRNGTVISRYHKYNLFDDNIGKPLQPAIAIFDTDFGVRFGHFIGFDLMFREPAMQLVGNLFLKVEL
jgi:predicted amidohydrolase